MDDTDRIVLTVWRNFENRKRNEPDDGPLALAAHQRRQKILEEDLHEPTYNVVNWGFTKDKEAHEGVELIIHLASDPNVQSIVGSIGLFVAGAIAEGVKSIIADGVKGLWNKLTKRAQSDDIDSFQIVVPAREGGTVTISSFSDGSGASIVVNAKQDFQEFADSVIKRGPD
jgi:hypothetical protein